MVSNSFKFLMNSILYEAKYIFFSCQAVFKIIFFYYSG